MPENTKPEVFRKEGGHVVMTEEFKLHRVRAYYRDFVTSISEDKRVLVKEGMAGRDYRKGFLAFYPDDLMKPVFLYAFLSIGQFPVAYTCMNIYRLIDIYFQRDEEYQTLSQIQTPYILLYGGYAEKTIATQEQYILQIMELAHVRGQVVWMFFKGSESALFKGSGSAYPNVWKLAGQQGILRFLLQTQKQREEIKERKSKLKEAL